MEAHSKATEHHLPYEITVLPVTRHRWTCPALGCIHADTSMSMSTCPGFRLQPVEASLVW